MDENLDNYAGAYKEDFKYSLDNDLIIKTYVDRALLKMRGGSLLELGIGHGISGKLFSERFETYHIVEGSLEIIEMFKSKVDCSRIDIHHDYFEQFEINETFDNIVMGFVLEHVEDPDFIISKYIKLLNKNGKLIITVPNSDALNRRYGFEAGLLESLDWLSEYDKQQGHKRYFNLQSLTHMVKKHHLKIISIEGLFLKPITTDQIKALKLSGKILESMMKVGLDYPELCVALLMEVEQ